MPDKFKELLEQRRAEYKTYSPMLCLVIGERVVFGSAGFHHLRFRANGKERKFSEQMYKLGLLSLVRPTIRLAKDFSYQNRGGIEYWGLEAVVGRQNVKIRVILRKINGSSIHFWSVMKLR